MESIKALLKSKNIRLTDNLVAVTTLKTRTEKNEYLEYIAQLRVKCVKSNCSGLSTDRVYYINYMCGSTLTVWDDDYGLSIIELYGTRQGEFKLVWGVDCLPVEE